MRLDLFTEKDSKAMWPRLRIKRTVVFDRISPECWKHLHIDTVLLMNLDTTVSVT